MQIKEFVEKHGVANLRSLIPMRKVRHFAMISYTSDLDEEVPTECTVDEGRYKVSDNYKITLRSTIDGFSSQTFYIRDLESLMKMHPDRYSFYAVEGK